MTELTRRERLELITTYYILWKIRAEPRIRRVTRHIHSSTPAISNHSELTNVTGDQHHAQLHAATHYNAAADPVKLDDFATPDDNADLNATVTEHGLLKKLDNVDTNFMNGQGNWAAPTGALHFRLVEDWTNAGLGNWATHTVAGLDLDADGGYYFELVLYNNNAAGQGIDLRPNGDAVLANYESQWIYGNGVAITANRSAASARLATVSPFQTLFSQIFMSPRMPFNPRVKYNAFSNMDSSTATKLQNRFYNYAVAANVTSVEFVSGGGAAVWHQDSRVRTFAMG